MKKLYTLIAAALLATGATAQNPSAYFMEGSTFRSQFNPAFAPLRNDDLFRDVRIDAGGYGISWSDEIDLSSSEIYECGTALDVAAIEKAALLREIVAARQGAGLSQNAVEEASGIRQPVIARMETAATNPQLDTILRALAPLGKTLAVVDVNEEVTAL